MIFTPNEIEKMVGIIEKYHLTFIAESVGSDILTDSDIATLKASGIDAHKISPKTPLFEQAFKFGIIAEALGDIRAKGMDYADFEKFLVSGQFYPLTKFETSALDSVKRQAYHDIKGLGNKISQKLGTTHIEVDQRLRAKREKLIEEAAYSSIEKRKGVKGMLSELGHSMGDWERDLGRISEYVMHSAYEEGRAAQIQAREGKDAYVYKDVYPRACRHCIKHYLTGGIGSQPKIFKLSQLKANGTNIGKKQANWSATLGPVHPWCRCTLNYIPEGYQWDEDKKAFNLNENYERKVARKSKIKVTIGSNNYEV